MATNPTIRRILFATDFSENSRLALDFAVSFAEQFQATVVMLHVVLLSQAAQEAEMEIAGPSVSRHSAEQRLNTLADGLRRLNLEAETHVVEGLAGDVVLESIDTYRADLLVLGIHGIHHGLTYLLMGSTTELLVRHATCPLLTVGPNVLSGFDLKKQLDRIIFLADLSPESVRAAELALFLSKAFHASVEERVWVAGSLRDDEERRCFLAAEFVRHLTDIVAVVPSEWQRPEYHMGNTRSTDQIIAEAEQQNAAMIVLGIHSLHTSFARQVLSLASCPVITVRQAAPELKENAS